LEALSLKAVAGEDEDEEAVKGKGPAKAVHPRAVHRFNQSAVSLW